MAPRKTSKKNDDVSEGLNLNVDIMSDTMPHVVDSIRSWMQIFTILEHEVINFLDDSGDEKNDTQGTKIKIIAESELHKISTWLKLMPYNDMISWVLENTDVQTRSIINHQKVVAGSFSLEHLQVMYKISPNTNYIYNVVFMMEFEQKECV